MYTRTCDGEQILLREVQHTLYRPAAACFSACAQESS